MKSYKAWRKWKGVEYGEKFDDSDLAPQFIPHFETGQRIEVDFGGYVKRGYVGVTTGWKPAFLLVLRKDSLGSSHLLGRNDKVTGTFDKYR